MRHAKNRSILLPFLSLLAIAAMSDAVLAQVAVRGKTVYTMAGTTINDGVVIIQNGKITAVGPAASTPIPSGFKVLEGEVVTPGLVDAHSTVGLTGIYNSKKHDQDQLEHSSPMQPELRAIDAYNPHEKLIEWVRGFGITTVHTGHAPGELISGQTCILKTTGNTVEDAVMVETAAVAATLAQSAKKSGKGKSPGTRGKMMAVLRAKLIKAQEYKKKIDNAEEGKEPARDLGLETLVKVLNREIPLMVTAHKAQDIASTLRLAKEFEFKLILDGASEGYLLTKEIKAAGVPVIVHPLMIRAYGDYKNFSFETPARLAAAGIPVALQSGYESYVPKVRVALYEAAIAAANGMTFEQALGTITISAAKILGIADQVGSLEVGKDGDVAIYDGDPFEYTSHCTGVVINGRVASDTPQ
jgi:imidazolonepropionase-like amidohydrolase